jgi:hypothetical protein
MARTHILPIIALIGASAGVPAIAQPATAPSQAPGRSEARNCMIQHLPGGVAEIRSSMQSWQQSNPGATDELRREQRRALASGWRSSHPEEVQAARAACASGGPAY